MGMLPVQIDDEHVVRVKDGAVSGDGWHYWLSLYRGDDPIAMAPCLLTGDPSLEEEQAMARGFAAAVLARES